MSGLTGHHMTSVLIIGTYRQTLTVIRSLARTGQNVILGIHGDAATCDYSRYVSEVWHHPNFGSEKDEFFSALMSMLSERDDIIAIFPVGEIEITLFFQKYAEISAHVNLLMCKPETAGLCLDKPRMSAEIDHLRIPQSRYETASDTESLYAAADSIGYPCIVKLADSEFLLNGKKAVIYGQAESLQQDFGEWPIENKSLIVQTYVAGERANLYFFACNGRIVSLGQVLALRTDRLDGTGLTVVGRTVSPDHELVGHCQAMVRHLDYTGPGCMQFIVDESAGITSFLENNPRLGAACKLPYLAGLDLPRLMLEFALEGSASPGELPYPCKTGISYTWTSGDIMGLKRGISSGEVSTIDAARWLLAMIKSNLTTPHHISWDWRDPLPSIVLLGRLCRSMLRSILADKN